MLTRTEAITLRSIDYGETSQIVTLFTRQYGRLTVMAKGSRGPRARFGSTLQPGAYAQAVFYYRPGQSVHTLSEMSHVTVWRNVTRDIEKLSISLRLVELVNALFLDGDAHERLFDSIVEILTRLDAEHTRPGNLWPIFQLRLATELGFEPAFERGDIDAVAATAILSLSDGRVVQVHGSGTVGVERAVLRAFAVFARASIESAMRLNMTDPVARRVNQLVESYLRYHVERAYPTRAAAVIEQLRRPDLPGTSG